MARIRTGDTKRIEKIGIELAIRWLRRRGYRPADVSDQHLGYDLRVGGRRVEVKASTKSRGWNNADIRKSCRVRWLSQDRHVEIRRRGLPFDDLIEVTRIGENPQNSLLSLSRNREAWGVPSPLDLALPAQGRGP